MLKKIHQGQYRVRRRMVNLSAQYLIRPVSLTLSSINEKQKLSAARVRYEELYNEFNEPLISITIATYNRSNLLIDWAINSVLQQTYDNYEIIVIGDGCTDDTDIRINQLRNPKIRFINLPQRGKYPEDLRYRWMVAGSVAINHALLIAKGLWIAHLDDDDIFYPNHLENMLKGVYTRNLEMAYGRRKREILTGEWEVTGGEGIIPHSSAFFRSYLKMFALSATSWRLRLATDHHAWIRMEKAGVRMGFVNELSFKSPLRPNNTQHHYNAEDYS